MKQFNEYCDDVGYNQHANAPKMEHSYAAYKNGNVEIFQKHQEAKQYSKNVETITTPESKAACNSFWNNQTQLHSKAVDLWYTDLKEEHSELKTRIFELCYNRAYEQSHSSGYDAVADTMYDIVYFADQILKNQ